MSNQQTLQVPPTAAALEGIVGLLNDLTPEQQQLFDEALERWGAFFEKRLVEWENGTKEN